MGKRVGRVGGDGGKQARVGDFHRSGGFAELGLGLQYILIGDVDLVFQCIELLVVVDLPPLAADHGVIGLRRFPSAGFLVGGGCRRGRGGWNVVGSDHAGGQEERQGGG